MDNRAILEYQIENLRRRRDEVVVELDRVKTSLGLDLKTIDENTESIDRVQKIVSDINIKIPKKTENEKMDVAANQILDYIETIDIFKAVYAAYKKIGEYDKKFITVSSDRLMVDQEFLIQNERLTKNADYYRGDIIRYNNNMIEFDGEIYKRERKLEGI